MGCDECIFDHSKFNDNRIRRRIGTELRSVFSISREDTMMQSSTNTSEQKKRSKQDVKAQLDKMGHLGLKNVQSLRLRRRPTGGRNFKQRNSSNQLGRRFDVLGPLLHESWRARLIVPSRYRGLSFQPGNGDLNRRGPIPDFEPLPGRRNEPPFRRQVVLRHLDATVISDDENDDEEEHEYLPTKVIGHGNHIVGIDAVSVDSVSDNDTA